MTIPALAEVAAAAAAIVSPAVAQAEPAATSVARTSQASFGGMVGAGLQQVNQSLLVSQQDMQNLAVGNVQSLHQVMIRLEESKIAFQLMLQVRNRLLESYQDVMRMQV
ncbi:flagellar hook-basal body complex protein FliE [Cupriavidus sp. SW-Y-13]|uniref:flagellar hook-basal body complex protein FliE n=1 Tax=Cupriavidus sp. SW-Y-13 TaxID=2653854 RepID=UPI001365C5AC|nr:flagellar hook-basal body complex protein FliE [Cupriavidus sp. SW-Y-13]MWL90527.1 flagellar hook-basal body complex protein FliE [Cupriavidus sp. SW-Y-13]